MSLEIKREIKMTSCFVNWDALLCNKSPKKNQEMFIKETEMMTAFGGQISTVR